MRMRDAVLDIKAKIENKAPDSVKNFTRNFVRGLEVGSAAWGVRSTKTTVIGLSGSMEDTVNTIRRKRQELLNRYRTNREQNPEAGDRRDAGGAGMGREQMVENSNPLRTQRGDKR